MKALILAGGFGTRIKHLFPDLPKPMIPVNGRPFLEILIDKLIDGGITQVFLAVYHQKRAIINHFGHQYKNINIQYIVEDEPLGTGGAILNACNIIDDYLMVLNGDTFCDANYQNLFQKNCDICLVLTNVSNVARYGAVNTMQNHIVDFCEKGGSGSGLINAGIYLVHPRVFSNYTLPKKFSFEDDFLKKYIKQLQPSYIVSDGYFIDIGIEEDYRSFVLKSI